MTAKNVAHTVGLLAHGAVAGAARAVAIVVVTHLPRRAAGGTEVATINVALVEVLHSVETVRGNAEGGVGVT